METTTQETDHISEEDIRLKKLEELKKKHENVFEYSYNPTHKTDALHKHYNSLTEGEKHTDKIILAGRITAKRDHGKAFFGNIQDDNGTVQFYANVKEVGEEKFNELLSLDTGDIIGIEGTPFKTRRGELTVNTNTFTLLTKSLLPLPEKHHGLQNIELRYRHRYLDLIANPDVKSIFKTRSKAISMIRHELEKLDFIEVETPVLQNIYGGAMAKPFDTFHNELEQNLYLRISLELYLKRLIVGGFEKIFEIGRVFRNEGISYKHNPEYTLLELYQAYADYEDMMTLTENLIRNLVTAIHGKTKITYKDHEIDFSKPFKRIKLTDSIEETCNIDCNDEKALQQKIKELKLKVPENASKGHMIMELYDELIEPTLIQPTFIIDHPWETSPLAKKHRKNKNNVERFELIISGMEIANAFSELNDPIDQYERFIDQLKAKEKGLEDAQLMDEDFIKSLKHGMPPTGGLGIGIDRVIMLLTNSSSIREVIFFPHMRDK
ncbi:lysine--tRNA ligase [Candidatus Marinamargulisbacteria bacterium SCGC AG-343-D04]|nr:lysine--tRNA ligase [Candidatus Marinamargulisbacteria bacterium SCGC AG-343-D04]